MIPSRSSQRVIGHAGACLRAGLTRAAARVLPDQRRSASVTHSVRDMLAQRVYALCCGWEDVTDHNRMRRDLALQTAVGCVEDLASGPTLSRLETAATPAHAAALNGVLVEQFIAAQARAPKELVLDIDASHEPLHGAQERAHFHSYYDNYYHLPLYVFCGQDLLACVLRPSSRDPASVLSALVKLLVRRLREKWPKVRVTSARGLGLLPPPGAAALRVLGRGLRHRIAEERSAAAVRGSGRAVPG